MARKRRASRAKKKLERWVVKAGSNMIMSGGPLLLRAWMAQVARLRKKHGIEVIWVSSGAIANAIERTNFTKSSRTLSEKQALSAIGQPLVMDLYGMALGTQGLLGAQVLLTYEDLADRIRRANFQNTLEQLLRWGVTPILNENDAVATQEIKFGDNDSLSARVAKTMNADKLVILTDVEGLFDLDPRKHANARLITELPSVTPALLRQVEKASGYGGGTARGTGGMLSKLIAARLSSGAGIETWLVKGDEPQVLIDVAQGQSIGTRIAGRTAKKGR